MPLPRNSRIKSPRNPNFPLRAAPDMSGPDRTRRKPRRRSAPPTAGPSGPRSGPGKPARARERRRSPDPAGPHTPGSGAPLPKLPRRSNPAARRLAEPPRSAAFRRPRPRRRSARAALPGRRLPLSPVSFLFFFSLSDPSLSLSRNPAALGAPRRSRACCRRHREWSPPPRIWRIPASSARPRPAYIALPCH